MKKIIFFLAFYFSVHFSFGQNEQYNSLVKRADSLYNAGNYKVSASTYTDAFKANGWMGSPTDRYNASCSWSLANNADSSFSQLMRITTKANYKNYEHITTDPDLISLHNDNRWKTLIDLVKQNKEKAEVNLNKPLVAELDSIYNDDQKFRLQLDEIEKKYGWQSNEIKAHWKIIKEKDSINLIKVKSLLDKYGWLGPEIVSIQGNQTLFLVIQHSDQQTQEKYLPMMREAVKEGKAQGNSLALLEDRVALGQGKKQIYGSQIGRNNETKLYYVLPLSDPENVDKRRAEVGLQPLAEYVTHWQIKWDVEQYKKDLPLIEEQQKVGHK